MCYVGKQLNSVNYTKLYWSVYKQHMSSSFLDDTLQSAESLTDGMINEAQMSYWVSTENKRYYFYKVV